MFNLFEFIGNYTNNSVKNYGDINKPQQEKIKSMLSDKELAIYEQIKESDRQRLLKYQ